MLPIVFALKESAAQRLLNASRANAFNGNLSAPNKIGANIIFYRHQDGTRSRGANATAEPGFDFVFGADLEQQNHSRNRPFDRFRQI